MVSINSNSISLIDNVPITVLPQLKNKEQELLKNEVYAFCQRNQIILTYYGDLSIRIAATKQLQPEILSALKFLSERSIETELWSKEKFHSYQLVEDEKILVIDENIVADDHHNTTEHSTVLNPAHEQQQSVAVNFVTNMINSSIKKRASDIHLEPFNNGYRIRIRIDGQLMAINSPSPEINAEIVVRLKIISGLDIAEKRLPQDGQFNWLESKQRYALRISTLPTLYGEKIVLRILNTLNTLSLDNIGLPEHQNSQLKKCLQAKQGMILVTGPTGSGKTMTLYSCLQYINQSRRNISSVEDPVEIPLAGINQTPINPKIGLDFSTLLRSLLRQDPDVIMIGEIRDQQTAEIAIKAAHTGHLVLSTLHTNSPQDTITRLQQLNIEEYFLHSCIRLIIAQRLVRTLCLHCKKRQTEPVEVYLNNAHTLIYPWQAQGCQQCLSGFSGRSAFYTFLLPQDNKVENLSADKRKSDINNMAGLLQSGLILVEQGVTTLDEIHQAVGY